MKFLEMKLPSDAVKKKKLQRAHLYLLVVDTGCGSPSSKVSVDGVDT